MAYARLYDYKVFDVQKYIDGYELPNIDKLEDDPKFMAAVIANPRGNCKVYKLCSDRVKADYDFMDTFITLCYDNSKLLVEACNNFVKSNLINNEHNINTIEVLARTVIIISSDKEFKKNNPEIIKSYEEELEKEYLNTIKEYNNNKPYNNSFGFNFLSKKYCFNRYILFYYAKRMIKDILERKDIGNRLLSIYNSENYIGKNGETVYISRELDENEKIVLYANTVYSCDLDLKQYISMNYMLYYDMIQMVNNKMPEYLLNNQKNVKTLLKNISIDSKKVVE